MYILKQTLSKYAMKVRISAALEIDPKLCPPSGLTGGRGSRSVLNVNCCYRPGPGWGLGSCLAKLKFYYFQSFDPAALVPLPRGEYTLGVATSQGEAPAIRF